MGPCNACVLCRPGSGPFLATFQVEPFLVERDLRPRVHLQRLAVDFDFAGVLGLAQNQAGEVLRFDVVGCAAVGALRVHFRSLVVLLQAVEGNPVAAVVARGVGQEADVVGRALTFVAVFLEKRVEPLADQRAGAVTRGLGNASTGRERLGSGGNRDRRPKGNLPSRVARGHGGRIPVDRDRSRRRGRRAGDCRC